MPETKLSDFQPEDLAHAVLGRLRLDYDWRSQWLGGTPGIANAGLAGSPLDGHDNLEKAASLFEAFTSQNAEDTSIPRVNLIHKAVEDFLSVALTNIPKAHVKIDRFMGAVADWERPFRLFIIEQAREVMEAYVDSIKGRNHYDDLIQRVVTHSAVFGVGYMFVGVDKTLDVRQDYMIRDLMNKEDELTEEEMRLLQVLTNRIDLKVIDPRDVYWRHSIRDVQDEGMIRVTIVEHMDTETLRSMYKGTEFIGENTAAIKPGDLPFFLRTNHNQYQFSTQMGDTTTPVVTMYELEHADMERIVETDEGEEVIPFTDWIMHKVVLAGNALVEYETWDSADGPLRLPVVPVYLRKSVNHPYGWSLPLMLEKSEEYINAIQTIIFKSARRAVSAQGVAAHIPSMGEGDVEELEHVLEEGGVARIHGNNVQGPVDIREMIQPLNFTQSSINPALLQGLNLQMQMFGSQSQEVDAGAIGAARSGAAKRAQIAVADRPKTISINVMSEGIEGIIDNIIELIRVFHQEQITVFVDTADGSRDQVTLNEPYQKTIMIADPQFETFDNPLGIELFDFDATLNSTLINMWAVSDGRSELPLDIVSRYQLGIALVQAGAIQPETLRELVLASNDEIKAFDDRVVYKNKMELVRQQLMVQQAQAMAQQQAQPSLAGQVGTIPADSFTSVAPQDNVQDQIDSVQGSPIATPSNPFAL